LTTLVANNLTTEVNLFTENSKKNGLMEERSLGAFGL